MEADKYALIAQKFSWYIQKGECNKIDVHTFLKWALKYHANNSEGSYWVTHTIRELSMYGYHDISDLMLRVVEMKPPL
jgi:hypothetical protein